MQSLGRLLRSAARTEILRVLVSQPGPVGLRQAARLAGVHPHSAELVLAGLVREKLARRQRAAHLAFYELDSTHADVPLLEAVFAAATQAHIRARSAALQDRAKSILPFLRQASRILNHARRSRHVA